MQKIINVICHPSQIALYFNDKVYKIIIWFICLLSILTGIIVAYAYKTDVYSYDFVRSVTNSLITKEGTPNVTYSESTLKGEAYSIKGDTVFIYFAKSDFAHNDYGLVFNFKETEVDVYYRFFSKKTMSYKDMNISDFTFADVKNGINNATIKFESLIYHAVNLINNEARLMNISDSLVSTLSMFLLVIGVALLLSFFVNPLIKFPHRVRICLYDSMIYLILIIFSLMLQAAWLQYVALAVPLIYTSISFRRIVVIKR